MSVDKLNLAGYECKLYMPSDYPISDTHYPIIYVNGEIQLEQIVGLMIRNTGKEPGSLIFCVEPQSWENDFTPWKAPALSSREADFGGGCADYIRKLETIIKPYVDAQYRTLTDASHTSVAGYSLGGLAALYALYRTSIFGQAASLSGSLWYDGFIPFMEGNSILNRRANIYLSLGCREKVNRNRRLGTVAECTEKAVSILRKQQSGDECCFLFEWNPGGHFTEAAMRFAKALIWLEQAGNRYNKEGTL